jgi:hypothetical protein
MRSGKATAALALLLALLTGCGPKQPKATVAQAAQEPSLPPQRMIAMLPPVPPAIPVLDGRPVKLDTTAPPEAKPEVATAQPHRPPKHHAKPVQDLEVSKNSAGPSPTAAQTTEVATAQPSEMTSIGQLSTANDNSNTADRHGISTQIDTTENGLNAIKRPLSSDEQKTAALIRTYITRARDALKADDLDGATTLSRKAQQLLEELTKQ